MVASVGVLEGAGAVLAGAVAATLSVAAAYLLMGVLVLAMSLSALRTVATAGVPQPARPVRCGDRPPRPAGLPRVQWGGGHRRATAVLPSERGQRRAVPLLQTLRGPEDLRALPPEQLPVLAAEIRDALVSSVAKTGGHLGP